MDEEVLDQVQERFAAIAMLMEDGSARLLATAPTAREARETIMLLQRVLRVIGQHTKIIKDNLGRLSDGAAPL